MIVVATHNGKGYLPGLLEGFEKFGTGKHEVLVLDTGSTCKESLELLQTFAVKKWPFKLEVSKTPYEAYDTGAYVHAFRNWPMEDYLFVQDSICPKRKDWVSAFEAKATFGVGCVPWLIFPMQWDNQEEVDWMMEKCGVNDWPPFGIFGPIFYAKREALESLDKRGLLDILPSCKNEQMAMERVWPTAFNLAGYAVRPVETNFSEALLKGDEYTHLTKQFALRA
jgi:hypothetical protein